MKSNKKMYVIGAALLAGQMLVTAPLSQANTSEDDLNSYQLTQYEQELQMEDEQLQLEENMPGDEAMFSENDQEFLLNEETQLDENFPQEEDQFAQYEEEQPFEEELQLMEEEPSFQEQENQ